MEILQDIGLALSSERTLSGAASKIVSLLRHRLPRYTWVGVYRLRGDVLRLEAWDGPKSTEHIEIRLGEGICGLAARTKQTVIVDDVSKDPRYLECFPETRSEIVVPILRKGRVLGEIDVDSDKLAAFHELDRMFLEWLADLLSEKSG